MKKSVLDRLLEDRREGRAVAVVTALAGGDQRMIYLDDVDAEGELSQALAEAFARDRSRTVEIAGEEHFIHVFNPPLKLIMVGAVHVAQALIPIAEAAGYAVTIIDPRGAFATAERFPNVHLHDDWPDEVLPGLDVDHRSAFLALTHDPKIDDPALSFALRSRCFYIGALGSKKTHAGRRERLAANGFTEGELDRIYGPIGLDIGAQGVTEIAIAIMAEVTQNLRRGRTQGA
jgi:xanthine dehydrogenase accessory factor